jgi:hypothetical protein
MFYDVASPSALTYPPLTCLTTVIHWAAAPAIELQTLKATTGVRAMHGAVIRPGIAVIMQPSVTSVQSPALRELDLPQTLSALQEPVSWRSVDPDTLKVSKQSISGSVWALPLISSAQPEA